LDKYKARERLLYVVKRHCFTKTLTSPGRSKFGSNRMWNREKKKNNYGGALKEGMPAISGKEVSTARDSSLLVTKIEGFLIKILSPGKGRVVRNTDKGKLWKSARGWYVSRGDTGINGISREIGKLGAGKSALFNLESRTFRSFNDGKGNL